MGDLLGSLVWGAKSGQYCVIGGGSLHLMTRVSHLYSPSSSGSADSSWWSCCSFLPARGLLVEIDLFLWLGACGSHHIFQALADGGCLLCGEPQGTARVTHASYQFRQ
jgi:hypothetical protein